MFCPNCKTEYRTGFSICSDCGAQLVEHLDPTPTNRRQSHEGPELLWSGTDTAISGVILNALDDAGIPHHESKRDVGPLPGWSQPVYAIFIPSFHHEVAHAALEKAVAEFKSGARPPREPDSSSESSADDFEFPEDEQENAPSPDDIAEDYDPEQAIEEVWSGTDADIKDMLVASLRENGIGCELESENGFRIFVMPSSEARAREIIREVTDASPPN
jgi:hypothetical protein